MGEVVHWIPSREVEYLGYSEVPNGIVNNQDHFVTVEAKGIVDGAIKYVLYRTASRFSDVLDISEDPVSVEHYFYSTELLLEELESRGARIRFLEKQLEIEKAQSA